VEVKSVSDQNLHRSAKPPVGVYLLAAFFCFGAAMCSLTLFLLLFPGTALDAAWRLKPSAQTELTSVRSITIPLMLVVGAACVAAAVGLSKCAEWGRRVAIAVLAVNLIGDCSNAVLRADWRTLLGLPIGALMILYLMSRRVRRCFGQSPDV
jgi:hypothetical protein